MEGIVEKVWRTNVYSDGQLKSYSAALKEISMTEKHETGQWMNNRAENSHLVFRRRERAMNKFRSMTSLQNF
ncbi:MAG: DDE-type integrase/transposase/recombinase [Methylocystaceae bacterium]|nr:DDE-type integrase/transposase/recombinase [Methylocystaceae bacterium]